MYNNIMRIIGDGVKMAVRVYRKNCVKFKNKPSYDKIKKS